MWDPGAQGFGFRVRGWLHGKENTPARTLNQREGLQPVLVPRACFKTLPDNHILPTVLLLLNLSSQHQIPEALDPYAKRVSDSGFAVASNRATCRKAEMTMPSCSSQAPRLYRSSKAPIRAFEKVLGQYRGLRVSDCGFLGSGFKGVLYGVPEGML